MNGAEAIVDAFQRQGLERIYVYPGGTIAPVLDICVQRDLPIFTARHEQGAGYAALAHARLTGRAQVVMVTSGPGVTNVVTPVADAFYDSTPLVVLTGQVGTGDMRGERPVRQRGFQEVDTCALMAPISKAQLLATEPAQLLDLIDEAFRIAQSGRPGPVVVDLPMNAQRGAIPEGAVRSGAAPVATPPAPAPDAVAEAAAWIAGAQRPVIIAGQGVLIAGAQQELRALAALGGGIPVSQSLAGLGAFPTTDPLAVGFHGHTGSQAAGLAIHNADLAIVVGSRLDIRQTGSVVDQFVPAGRVIRIDLDPAELEHSRVRTHLNLLTDARAGLAALVAALGGRALPDWSGWRGRVSAWKVEHAYRWDPSGPLQPQPVIEMASRLTAGREVVALSGVGSHQQWVARHFAFDAPTRTWLTSAGHGAMGYDVPAAVGAQLAFPGRVVLCFVGDGSFQINIQELGAIAEHRLPVKLVVLDNHRLGIVSQFQLLNWPTDPTCGGKWNPDFAAIGRAYGIPARTVVEETEVEAALRWLLDTEGPALLHCQIDPRADVVPMLLGGQTMDAMWHG